MLIFLQQRVQLHVAALQAAEASHQRQLAALQAWVPVGSGGAATLPATLLLAQAVTFACLLPQQGMGWVGYHMRISSLLLLLICPCRWPAEGEGVPETAATAVAGAGRLDAGRSG